MRKLREDTEVIHFEADRYFVQIESEQYLVELGAYEGFGFCGCRHFQMKLQPLLEREVTPACQCKHIILALGFANQTMQNLHQNKEE